jgi:hypothetical protein
MRVVFVEKLVQMRSIDLMRVAGWWSRGERNPFARRQFIEASSLYATASSRPMINGAPQAGTKISAGAVVGTVRIGVEGSRLLLPSRCPQEWHYYVLTVRS